MRIKNAGGHWSAWKPYAKRKGWRLTRGEGKKRVYVQCKDGAGNTSARVMDSITYRP
jgi:hypothetical protein